jgi:broad specificity phosphatase PhoE
VERVILVRHAESEFSVRGAVNGDLAVACPLTASGELQARRLGEQLAGERIDLCATSQFERARTTADIALDGRGVPRLILADLNDPRYGRFEGALLEDYRAWAHRSPSSTDAPGGGESRRAIVERYARAFRTVLSRPEDAVLVVSHSLPVAYVLGAREGRVPGRRVEVVEYAHPYRLGGDQLERAVQVLEEWLGAPTW